MAERLGQGGGPSPGVAWFQERAAFEAEGRTRDEWDRMKREAQGHSKHRQCQLPRAERRKQDPNVQLRAAKYSATVAGVPASASGAVAAPSSFGQAAAEMPGAGMPDTSIPMQRDHVPDSSESEQDQQKEVVKQK